MSKIVLRGGPFCGEEFRSRQLPETWQKPDLPTVPPLVDLITAGDAEPSHMPAFPRYVDYQRTGLRSLSGAHVYDWVGLNWGWDAEAVA